MLEKLIDNWRRILTNKIDQLVDLGHTNNILKFKSILTKFHYRIWTASSPLQNNALHLFFSITTNCSFLSLKSRAFNPIFFLFFFYLSFSFFYWDYELGPTRGGSNLTNLPLRPMREASSCPFYFYKDQVSPWARF